MRRADRLRARLQQAFQPVAIEIIDESGRHAGHQEHFDGSGETHLRIRIVADAFAGMSRVERHRAVNRLAAEELAAGLHALAIEARTPAEAGR
ncbi:MAG: transcriptional regulator [Alphaproteobacteria bacterium]|nr:MAG: transcriptional regulator [Alphaproteobacteria bacterium]